VKNIDDRKRFAKTLFEALDQVAVHNLTLGTMAQHVDIHTINEAIKDEKGNFLRNRRVVYCAMQYQGLLEICYRNKKIKAIKATVVRKRKGEVFIWRGPGEKPTVEIPLESLTETGPIVGAWALAELANGSIIYEFMDSTELAKVKGVTKPGSIKDSWEEEWSKKVVLRRLTKSLPKTREMQEWEEIDNEGYDLKQLPQKVEKPNKIQEVINGNQ
jgi:recombinational DNA repair protein RecT